MQKSVMAAVLVALTMGEAMAAAKEETVPYQMARQQGVKQCLGAVRKVSEFLIGERKHRASCTWKTAAPDKAPFICEIEAQYEKGVPSLDTMSVSPQASGGCTMEYSRVTVFSKDCDQVHDTTLAGFQERRGNWEHFRAFDMNQGNAYTTRLAGGCLVVRRQVLFE